jgi:hypothetical protein
MNFDDRYPIEAPSLAGELEEMLDEDDGLEVLAEALLVLGAIAFAQELARPGTCRAYGAQLGTPPAAFDLLNAVIDRGGTERLRYFMDGGVMPAFGPDPEIDPEADG